MNYELRIMNYEWGLYDCKGEIIVILKVFKMWE